MSLLLRYVSFTFLTFFFKSKKRDFLLFWSSFVIRSWRLFHTFIVEQWWRKFAGLVFVWLCMHVQYICKKSGWAENSKQWKHCHELFIELWSNLQVTADNDDDGQITVDEWVSACSYLHRGYMRLWAWPQNVVGWATNHRRRLLKMTMGTRFLPTFPPFTRSSPSSFPFPLFLSLPIGAYPLGVWGAL